MKKPVEPTLVEVPTLTSSGVPTGTAAPGAPLAAAPVPSGPPGAAACGAGAAPAGLLAVVAPPAPGGVQPARSSAPPTARRRANVRQLAGQATRRTTMCSPPPHRCRGSRPDSTGPPPARQQRVLRGGLPRHAAYRYTQDVRGGARRRGSSE